MPAMRQRLEDGNVFATKPLKQRKGERPNAAELRGFTTPKGSVEGMAILPRRRRRQQGYSTDECTKPRQKLAKT